MNSKELNHAIGLLKSLEKKSCLLVQQADDLDAAKEGRSPYAARLRDEVARLRDEAARLQEAAM